MVDTQTESPRARGGLKRYLLIGAPIVLLGVIALILSWPRLTLGFDITALNSDNPETRRERRRALIEAPREAWVDDQLRSAVEDADRSFEVRHVLVGILHERNRLSSHIEPAYLAGDLDTRSVILAYLRGQEFFDRSYAQDPRFAVRETVAQWIARDGDFSRSHAIQIARQLEMVETVDAVRAILAPPGSPSTLGKRRDHLLIAALSALEHFRDCQSVDRMIEMAQTELDAVVRWRAAQIADRMVTLEQAACPGAVDESVFAELMARFLQDTDPVLRIGALTSLEMHPGRAQGLESRLLEILDGNVVANRAESPDRRHALNVLMAQRDPAFLDRLPTYFFDENTSVRSSLVQRASGVVAPRLDGGLIGIVAREVTELLVFRAAVEALRAKRGRWEGLSPKMLTHLQVDGGQFQADIDTLFSGGGVDGTTRATMAEAWFRWLATDLGLDEPAVARALATRTAFWEAADRGDAATAQRTLDEFGTRTQGLFVYEEGWIAARGG